MAQFDVYPNPTASARKSVPCVIVLQSDLAPIRGTTIVAPLARKGDPGAKAQLQRAVLVEGEPLVLLFQGISAVRSSELTQRVTSIPEIRDHMMAALDLLFLGF